MYATRLTISPLQERFRQLEVGVAGVDLALLLVFVVLAVRGPRYWPIWAAGLQLVTLFGHAALAFHDNLAPWAYGASVMGWGYLVLLSIALGSWRTPGRRDELTI